MDLLRPRGTTGIFCMECVAYLHQLVHILVATRPVTHGGVEIADMAKRPEHPDDARDIARIDSTGNQRGPRCGEIRGCAIKLHAGLLQIERVGNGALILPVCLGIPGLGVQVQVQNRILLSLGPEAFAADIRAHRRHHAEAHCGERHQKDDHEQERPDHLE